MGRKSAPTASSDRFARCCRSSPRRPASREGMGVSHRPVRLLQTPADRLTAVDAAGAPTFDLAVQGLRLPVSPSPAGIS